MQYNTWLYSVHFKKYYYFLQPKHKNDNWGWVLRDNYFDQEIDFYNGWKLDEDPVKANPLLQIGTKKKMIRDLFKKLI